MDPDYIDYAAKCSEESKKAQEQVTRDIEARKAARAPKTIVLKRPGK